MRSFAKIISLVLVLSLCLAVPANAQEVVPYGSSYFGSHTAYLWETSNSSFQVWFSVTAVGTMTELGVNYINIERSSDGSNWSVVQTYDSEDYSNLIAYNTHYHSGYVTYSNRQTGYQYRAYVDLHAKKGSGTASYGTYAYF